MSRLKIIAERLCRASEPPAPCVMARESIRPRGRGWGQIPTKPGNSWARLPLDAGLRLGGAGSCRHVIDGEGISWFMRVGHAEGWPQAGDGSPEISARLKGDAGAPLSGLARRYSTTLPTSPTACTTACFRIRRR